MARVVDIDSNSGFCGGVIRAITRAEECLSGNSRLYSLGAIVHNEAELSRLESRGMVTIDLDVLDKFEDAEGKNLLIRAHGEPPRTYEVARSKGFNIIDCTCPVVLKLQQNIRNSWDQHDGNVQVIIFGKVGHAEVLGLLGQIDGNAVVIEDMASLEKALSEGAIDLSKPVEVFSQTTKSPSEYEKICARLSECTKDITVHNTICSQVGTRHSKLAEFAETHDVIVFVSGQASSNGKVLFELCQKHNPRTYHIDSEDAIDPSWFGTDDKVGVCGATSTPKWLLERVAQKILQIND